MPYPNIFDPQTTKDTLERLEKLTPDTQPNWGKMDAAQMLAHLNVTYDVSYGKAGTPPGAVMRFFLKQFLKPIVVGERPYKKNSRTSPNFVIADERDFENEKARLIAQIKEAQNYGETYFDGMASPSFGKMTAKEWSNQFWKHMDHHFRQFDI